MGEVDREPAGVLVISVLALDTDGRLLARIRAIDRLDAEPRSVTLVGTPDVLASQVDRWLSAVATGQPMVWDTAE